MSELENRETDDRETINPEMINPETINPETINPEVVNPENAGQVNGKGETQKKEEMFTFRELFQWGVTFAVVLACCFLVKKFIIINARIPSGSMENTIMTGDLVIGNRLAYINKDPERGDIIIFPFPDDESQEYIKRIIGLPGEHILIEDGKIYINGSEEPLEEAYLWEEWVRGTGPYEFDVPEDSYLVLGDHRNTSVDARYWNNKYVAREKITAKAVCIYWPLNHITSLKGK